MKKYLKACSFVLAALMLTAFIPLFTGCMEKNYKINFDSNGGSAVESMHVKEATYVYDDELPVPTREGYVFRGWNIVKNTNVKYESFYVNQNITLYAIWVKKHNVNLVLNNNEAPVVVEAVEDEFFYPGFDYADDGFVIKNWYVDETLETLYEAEKLQAETTLYAELLPAFKINFVTNGGSAVESTKIAAGNYTYVYQTSTKEGYKFEGWYEDAALTQKYQDRILDRDLTLYARFVDKNVIFVSASNFKTYFSYTSEAGVADVMHSTVGSMTITTGYKYYYTINVTPKKEYANSEHSGAEIKVRIKVRFSQYQQGNVTASSDKTAYFDLVLKKENGYAANETFITTISGNVQHSYWIDSFVDASGEIYVEP